MAFMPPIRPLDWIRFGVVTLVGGAVLTGAVLPREASGTGTVGSVKTDLGCC